MVWTSILFPCSWQNKLVPWKKNFNRNMAIFEDWFLVLGMLWRCAQINICSVWLGKYAHVRGIPCARRHDVVVLNTGRHLMGNMAHFHLSHMWLRWQRFVLTWPNWIKKMYRIFYKIFADSYRIWSFCIFLYHILLCSVEVHKILYKCMENLSRHQLLL